jgi:glycosyltransferase XagB
VAELQRLPPAALILVLLLLPLFLAPTAMAGGLLWRVLHAWMAGGLLWRVLHAWRTSRTPIGTVGLEPAPAPGRSFSLIVPARHEQAGLGERLSRLATNDHPDFEVLVVIGDDDPATTAVAQQAARRHPGRIRVLLDTSQPKNKPKALNTALPACQGEVVGVLGAEDEVHPQLLRHVDARLTETGADVVQVRVQLMHHHWNWYLVHEALTSHLWPGRRRRVHAQQRFVPPGGNTVFVRTDRLREAGGWDPECLAEACELGVRLSARGATVAVADTPALVTREETPGTVGELFKRRTSWNQGLLQVLRKGEWRRLPTVRQRLLACFTLAMPFLQACTGLLIPLSLAATLLAKAPTLATAVLVVTLVPMLLVLVAEVVGLVGCCRNEGVWPRRNAYVQLVLGMLPYHGVLAAAAVRAVARELRGHRSRRETEQVRTHAAVSYRSPGG